MLFFTSIPSILAHEWGETLRNLRFAKYTPASTTPLDTEEKVRVYLGNDWDEDVRYEVRWVRVDPRAPRCVLVSAHDGSTMITDAIKSFAIYEDEFYDLVEIVLEDGDILRFADPKNQNDPFGFKAEAALDAYIKGKEIDAFDYD